MKEKIKIANSAIIVTQNNKFVPGLDKLGWNKYMENKKKTMVEITQLIK